MTYLGIDYGLKHIGLAIASTPIPEPIPTIHYTKLEDALTRLRQVITEHNITHLVLGISENHMADRTKHFKKELETFNLPIDLVDETLTSHEAKELLAHQTTPKKKNLIHSASATIILDRYLENHPFTP